MFDAESVWLDGVALDYFKRITSRYNLMGVQEQGGLLPAKVWAREDPTGLTKPAVPTKHSSPEGGFR